MKSGINISKLIEQSIIQSENGRTLYIVMHSFWNLLSSGFGYETNIAGTGEPLNFHIIKLCQGIVSMIFVKSE